MNFTGALSFLKKQTNIPLFLSRTTNYKINFPLAIATNLTIALSAIVPVTALEIKPIESDTTGIIEILDEFQELFVQEERLPINNPELLQLDPTKLILGQDYDVRLYFINEGARAKNQVGFTATNGANSQESLAFDNVSCHISNTDCQLASEDGVLNIGDYVELGSFPAGTKFDFWLLADGYNNPDPLYRYGADPASNPDGLQHLVAWEYKDYVVLGFEDLYGPFGATDAPNQNSDRDHNDMVLAFSFSLDKKIPENPNPTSVPEPTSTFGFLVLGIMGIYSRLKTQRS